jgi:hypothetical protein
MRKSQMRIVCRKIIKLLSEVGFPICCDKRDSISSRFSLKENGKNIKAIQIHPVILSMSSPMAVEMKRSMSRRDEAIESGHAPEGKKMASTDFKLELWDVWVKCSN